MHRSFSSELRLRTTRTIYGSQQSQMTESTDSLASSTCSPSSCCSDTESSRISSVSSLSLANDCFTPPASLKVNATLNLALPRIHRSSSSVLPCTLEDCPFHHEDNSMSIFIPAVSSAGSSFSPAKPSYAVTQNLSNHTRFPKNSTMSTNANIQAEQDEYPEAQSRLFSLMAPLERLQPVRHLAHTCNSALRPEQTRWLEKKLDSETNERVEQVVDIDDNVGRPNNPKGRGSIRKFFSRSLRVRTV